MPYQNWKLRISSQKVSTKHNALLLSKSSHFYKNKNNRIKSNKIVTTKIEKLNRILNKSKTNQSKSTTYKQLTLSESTQVFFNYLWSHSNNFLLHV